MVFAALLVLVAAACGSSGNSAGKPASTPATTPATTGTGAPGGANMPPFAGQLSAVEIQSVAEYVTNGFK